MAKITTINLEDVKKYKFVYIVQFYDGFVDGSKYSAVKLDTTYSGFSATYGALYYKSFKTATKIADELNKKQLEKVKNEK